MLQRCILESRKRVTPLSLGFVFILGLLLTKYNGTSTTFKLVNILKPPFILNCIYWRNKVIQSERKIDPETDTPRHAQLRKNKTRMKSTLIS